MNLQSTFRKLFPENAYGGQCGTFAHRLVEFPSVGNYIWQKRAAAKKYGVPDAKEGDVLITSESVVFGHVAVINADLGDMWQLTESNFNLNGRVHHTRTISKSSKYILGALRGKA